MKQFIFKTKRSATGILACLLMGLLTLSFHNGPVVYVMLEQSAIYDDVEPAYQDTVPAKTGKKHSMTMKEFDRLSEKLDKDISGDLKKIDLGKIEQDLQKIDIDKIMKQVEASLKDNDTEKLLAEVKKELANLHLEDMNSGTGMALAEAGKAFEQAEIELKKIDKDAIKKAMEEVKIQLEKSRNEKGKIDLSKVMVHAREGIEKAKSELKQLKTMFTEMENDRLIDSKKGFKITYKNKDLHINGNKQPQHVTDKYKKYFKGENFEITIDKE